MKIKRLSVSFHYALLISVIFIYLIMFCPVLFTTVPNRIRGFVFELTAVETINNTINCSLFLLY